MRMLQFVATICLCLGLIATVAHGAESANIQAAIDAPDQGASSPPRVDSSPLKRQEKSSAILAKVPWPSLPEHLGGRLISTADLGVVDCPANMQGTDAAATVIQWIENVFYKWREYRLAEHGLCIEMLRPDPHFLSASEAQVLLSASQLLLLLPREKLSPKAVIKDAGDPALYPPPVPRPNIQLPAPPAGGTDTQHYLPSSQQPPLGEPESQDTAMQPRSVAGSDDRESGYTTTVYPWNTIAFAGFNLDGNPYRATAFLVSPYFAMTNGHVVYDQTSDSWATDMRISPGQYVSGGSVVAPYGAYSADSVVTNTGFTNGSDALRYDYGGMKFNAPIPGVSTFMPLTFTYDIDNGSTTLNSAGYPSKVRYASTRDQWRASGPSSSRSTASDAHYLIDTSGGDSGSPIWVYSSNPVSRQVVALNAASCTFSDGYETSCGPRLYAGNQDLIESWVAWIPQGTPSPGGSADLTLLDASYHYRVPVYPNGSGELGYVGWGGDCDMTMMALDVESGSVRVSLGRNGVVTNYPDPIRDTDAMFAYSLYNAGTQGFSLRSATAGSASATAFFYCFGTTTGRHTNMSLHDARYFYNQPTDYADAKNFYDIGWNGICDMTMMTMDVESGGIDILLNRDGALTLYPDSIRDTDAMFAYALYNAGDQAFSLYSSDLLRESRATAFFYCFTAD